jgi:hypothetical protein
MAEVGVGRGGAMRCRSELAHLSAMAARDGGARMRHSVAAVGPLMWRRWGPAGVLLRWWSARGRRGVLNQERECSRREREREKERETNERRTRDERGGE